VFNDAPAENTENTPRPSIINATFFTAKQVAAMMPSSVSQAKKKPDIRPVVVPVLDEPVIIEKNVIVVTPTAPMKKSHGTFNSDMAQLDKLINQVSGVENEQVISDIINQAKKEKLYQLDVHESWSLDGIENISTLADISVVDVKDATSEHLELEVDNNAVNEEGSYVDPMVLYKRKIAKKLQKAMRVSKGLYGKKCIINITLSKDGLVLSTDVIRGSISLCREAEKATLRVGKLPMPDDVSLYTHLSVLQITISPHERDNHKNGI
jgi:hypothetical protein